ncbi:putative F-box/LRR-repeat protein At4g13960 [Papaver somniferum]|uniref:putative F-box/LRR-repeat protein At4g13960 n=1 Tax=Papaver somniferum TaxID=3469 RepID=UPI000E6FC943|nr:putative F-box/LRR-repeat protein At4g13960 [Papaver somniferum]
MDLKKQKLLHNIGEADDRISELPDPILHHILSFLDIKPVARTCILSKRWNDIWTSIPTLSFGSRLEPPSLSETNKFMEFLDRTLLLHDTSSNIQKFHLKTNGHMSASRVHSWISNLTKRNVKEVGLYIGDDGWNEQHFSNCPVLKKLIMQECTWSDVRNFSISTPTLKLLEIDNDRSIMMAYNIVLSTFMHQI